MDTQWLMVMDYFKTYAVIAYLLTKQSRLAIFSSQNALISVKCVSPIFKNIVLKESHDNDFLHTKNNTMSTRPAPLTIQQWLKEIGRRALVMTELATNFHHQSQDIVQDSLLSFINHYSDKPSEQWTPLFYGILRNQITDWKRKQARRSKWLTWFSSHTIDDEDEINPFEQIANSYEDNPAQLLANASDIKLVQQVLSTLPERQQQAFLLRAWEGLDIQTTSQIMGCSESSVKTHYSRALSILRSALNQANVGGETS